MALAAASVNDCPIYHILVVTGRRGQGHAALVARNWVPHKETKWLAGDHEDAAVAVAVDPAAPEKPQREAASGGDAVRRIQHEGEANLASVVVLEATANKTMKTTKIKLKETQGFNVENPSNAKGKNHGRQPARTSLYRVCVYNV